MTFQILKRSKYKHNAGFGRTRSELEERLRKDGLTTGMSDQELDHRKFLERKFEIRDGQGIVRKDFQKSNVD